MREKGAAVVVSYGKRFAQFRKILEVLFGRLDRPPRSLRGTPSAGQTRRRSIERSSSARQLDLWRNNVSGSSGKLSGVAGNIPAPQENFPT